MLRMKLDNHGLMVGTALVKGVVRRSAVPISYRLYSSEPSEMTDVNRNADPRIVPAEKSNSKAWNNVVDKLSTPDIEEMFRLRKFLANPRLRKELIKEVKRQQTPHMVLVDLIKNKGKFAELDDQVQSHLDRALSVSKWEDFPEDLETVVTRLCDLKFGQQVTILGAGISGLSLAWFISNSRPDLKIKIIEKSSKSGGYIESELVDNGLFEHGPRTLLPSHPGVIIGTQIMSDLGLIANEQLLGVPKKSPTNTKGIVYNNELNQLPRSFPDAVKFLFSPIMKGVKLGVVKDLLLKPRKSEINDESVESFISRRFNKKLSDRFLSALMRGIYAGDVSQLSARSVTRINKLYNLERLHGASIIGSSMTGLSHLLDKYPNTALKLLSQSMVDRVSDGNENLAARYSILSLKNGLQTFTDGLEKKLSENKNIEIVKNFEVTQILPTDEGCKIVGKDKNELESSIVLSTLSASKVGPLLTSSPEAQDLCKQVQFANLAVVNFQFKSNIAKDWFGFLVPKSEDGNNPHQVLGVVFDSSVANATEPVKKWLEKVEVAEKLVEQDKLLGMGEFEINNKTSKVDFTFEYLKSIIADQFSEEPATVVSTIKPPPTSNSATNSNGSTITVMMGGDLWSDLSSAELPDKATLISNAINALEKYLKITIPSDSYVARVTYQTNSIPQYTVGHGDLVNDIHNSISKHYNNRLYLSGTTFGKGVGVGDCIVDSLTIASRFSQQRKLLYPQFYINHYLTLTHPSLYA